MFGDSIVALRWLAVLASPVYLRAGAAAVAEQRDQAIFVCRNPATTRQQFWPGMRGEN